MTDHQISQCDGCVDNQATVAVLSYLFMNSTSQSLDSTHWWEPTTKVLPHPRVIFQEKTRSDRANRNLWFWHVAWGGVGGWGSIVTSTRSTNESGSDRMTRTRYTYQPGIHLCPPDSWKKKKREGNWWVTVLRYRGGYCRSNSGN